MITTNDKVEIWDLFARYVFTLDSGDGKGWAECFTEDGVFIRPHGSDAAGVAAVRAVGRDEIAKVCINAYAEGDGRRRRWSGNSQIWSSTTANDAEARSSMVLFVASGSDPAAIAVTGVFKDRLRKTDAGWLFAERALVLDVASPDA
jgi:uncharacterized protein (TIGR02246 family)